MVIVTKGVLRKGVIRKQNDDSIVSTTLQIGSGVVFEQDWVQRGNGDNELGSLQGECQTHIVCSPFLFL